MKLSKRVLFLLLINPVLMAVQTFIGWTLYGKIQTINNYRINEIQQRKYLRNTLFDLQDAAFTHNSFMISSDSLYLQSFRVSMDSIALRKEPEVVIDSDDFYKLRKSHRQAIVLMSQTNGSRNKDSANFNTYALNTLLDSIRRNSDAYFNMQNTQLELIQKVENRWANGLITLFILIFLFNLLFVYLAVTRVRREFARLQELNTVLDDKNQQLEQFTYMSYHQLREPLRHISGFLQLLKRKSFAQNDKEVTEYIDTSVAATQKLSGLIADLRSKYLTDNKSGIDDKA